MLSDEDPVDLLEDEEEDYPFDEDELEDEDDVYEDDFE